MSKPYCPECKREVDVTFSMGADLRAERTCANCARPLPQEAAPSKTIVITAPLSAPQNVERAFAVVEAAARRATNTVEQVDTPNAAEDLVEKVHARKKFLRAEIKRMTRELEALDTLSVPRRRARANVVKLRGAL